VAFLGIGGKLFAFTTSQLMRSTAPSGERRAATTPRVTIQARPIRRARPRPIISCAPGTAPTTCQFL
jgi:hypothetical protein